MNASGFTRSDVGFWLEQLRSRPFAQLRQSIDGSMQYRRGLMRLQLGVHAEADGAYFIHREQLDRPTEDAYQSLAYLRESHVGLSFDAVDVTFGKQIVAWGEGDVISPLDVVNPRDLREPGLADLDDLRVPVLSTRIAAFAGNHRFELMMLHEAFFGFWSPPRGPFSPLPAVIETSGALPAGSLRARVFEQLELTYRHSPDRYGLDAQQWLARWVYKGPSIDAGLYAASVRDQNGVLDGARLNAVLNVPLDDVLDASLEGGLAIEQAHLRYTLLGYSGSTSVGDFALKWELYANLNRAFNVSAPPEDNALFGVTVERRTAVGGMLGASYAGIRDTRLFLEFGKAWLVTDGEMVVFPFEAPNAAVRARHEAWRGDLTVDVAWTAIGWELEYGWVGRAEVGYRFRDGMRVALGAITYQTGDELSMLSSFARNDRLFFKYRWDFTL